MKSNRNLNQPQWQAVMGAYDVNAMESDLYKMMAYIS